MSSSATPEEIHILEKIRNAETRSYGFNLLIKTYHKRVYWLIRRMVIDHDDANDITQEVFIKLHLHLDNFREESRLFTWIYRVATNECLGFLRRKRRRFFLPIGDVEGELAGLVENGLGMDGNELEKRLQLAILRLPEKQRMVFQMRYFEELPYEEIAEITGTSIGALKASHHHAVKKLETDLVVSLNS